MILTNIVMQVLLGIMRMDESASMRMMVLVRDPDGDKITEKYQVGYVGKDMG